MGADAYVCGMSESSESESEVGEKGSVLSRNEAVVQERKARAVEKRITGARCNMYVCD